MPRDLPPEWQPDFPPVRSARQIAAAAEAAARASAQPPPAAELPLITAYLDMSLLELSCASRQLAQYRPVKRPGVICRNASEPGIYIDTAAQAISCISRDLRGPGDDEPDQPGTAAATAVRDLADATYTAFTAIRQPSGSLPAKDAAVSAFMHAIGIIDTAIGNLAACTPDPLAALLTRQRIRLEQACRSLREALVCSAVSQDDRPSLAAADWIRAAPDPAASLPGPARRSRPRDHRGRRGRPPAPHSPGQPAMKPVPPPPKASAVRQPCIPGGRQHCPHRDRPRRHSRRQVTRARSPPHGSGTNDTATCHKERKEMNQHDFEPAANEFIADPEFTGPGFSTPEDDTWTSHEHPGDADPYAPGGWGSPQEYGQPEEMNGQGVFVPGHDDPWETAPTPPYGTPRDRSARRIRLGPLAMAALALISVCVVAVIALPHARAIRLTPADAPGATASQHIPSVRSGRSSPPAEPSAITKTGAQRVLANYWRVNNAANQSRSDALLANIEAGSSYTMDAGAYQMSRVTDPADSQYAPFTAENAVYYIPRQPAGVYPRWFAARITYATLASPQHATGAGYVLFLQDSKNAAWKNVLEPYLLPSTGPAPFIETDAQGYAIQAALTSAAGLTASPAQIPQLTAQSLDSRSATLKNPGNLADLRDEAYFQARLPTGSAVTDRHDTSGLVFALKTVGGGALVFYHLTARLSLTPPPGQTINLGIPGYYSSSQALTSAAVDYADQFAVDIPAGSASPAIVADASGITGQG